MKRTDLSRDDFDTLLGWLAPDRDAAAEVFVSIREGLVRYFQAKGCSEPESLSDESLNRVAKKLGENSGSGVENPIRYVFGFAKNVFFEYIKQLRSAPIQLKVDRFAIQDLVTVDREAEQRLTCLDRCLADLSDDESSLILAYFGYDAKSRTGDRRDLAQQLNISAGNLHIRVFRIKAQLRDCIDGCMGEKVL